MAAAVASRALDRSRSRSPHGGADAGGAALRGAASCVPSDAPLPIRPLKGEFGALVDVRVSAAQLLSGGPLAGRLLQAWRGYGGLLVMRGLTDMTPKQFAEVSAIFGDVEPELDVNKRKYKVDEVSSVMRIGNTKDCNGNLNAMLALTPPLPASGSPQYQYAERLPVWHTDSTYRKHPPIGSTLFCRQAPPEGGATCFADMREAYDSLDAAMQERLLGLECVCSQAHHDAKVNRYSPEYPVLSPEQRAANPPNRVPMVLQHPQTGRLALYGMNSSTCAVLPKGTHLSAKQLDQYEVDVLEDASVEEWRKLLPSVTADRFTVTWQWEVGDFVVWDNRCTMHCATGYDTEQHTREMWRTTLAADKV